MSIILTPFAKLLLLFYNITGSYAISLVLFCLVIRLILFPVFLKGRKSMMAMNGLADQQKMLQQKYARDRERYSIELQKLYEREGVKPSGGCLWSLLPMPFLMALYAIIRQPLTYLMEMTEDHFNAVSNLLYGDVLSFRNAQLQIAQDVYNNYDQIVTAIPDLAGMPKIDFTFLGMNLSNTPQLMFWKSEEPMGVAFGMFLIPIISAVLSIITTIVTNKVNAKVLGVVRPMDSSTRATMIMMTLFSLWLCFTLPAALGVYWIANSVFAILQEFLNVPFLRKYLKKTEEEKAKRIEDEKERVKREKKAQAEAKKKAAEEMRRIQMERKLNKSIATASREGMRTYARGRLYDPDRYPTFPYKDPNQLAQEESVRQQLKAEEDKINQEAVKQNKKKDKKEKKADQPAPAVEEAAAVQPAPAVEEAAAVQPAAPVPSPAPAPAQEAPEEEEGFVEESFLEEPEDNEE